MSTAFERLAAPVLLLITAPSGAGKTTVGKNLLANTPGLERAVTCTTRPPRGGEQAGVDYHFLSRDEFAQGIEAGEFLEFAEVYGNRYGTRVSEVRSRLEAGRDVLLSVDVQGAEFIRERAASDPVLGAALVSIFILPPSLAELERRLRGRNEDAAEVIARRLAMAREEIERWSNCDYLVVSATPEEDLGAVKGILTAEKSRTRRVRHLTLH
ncbi:MAG: guanylate kinase [Verrucomicrobiales bacterium]|nr:guanylate kinase [Verrucomicrobiales bacterium]